MLREKVTWPGARVRKQDEGMPSYDNNHKKGSLFITFDVDFPKSASFSEEDKKGSVLLRNSAVCSYTYS